MRIEVANTTQLTYNRLTLLESKAAATAKTSKGYKMNISIPDLCENILNAFKMKASVTLPALNFEQYSELLKNLSMAEKMK